MRKIAETFLLGLLYIVASVVVLMFPLILALIFDNAKWCWLFVIHGVFTIYMAGKSFNNHN